MNTVDIELSSIARDVRNFACGIDNTSTRRSYLLGKLDVLTAILSHKDSRKIRVSTLVDLLLKSEAFDER